MALAGVSQTLSLPLLLALVLLLILLNRSPQKWIGLWHARWLLLTILVLYAGFTPGEPLSPQLPGLSREGFLEAARRMLILVLLIQAVGLLLRTTPVPQLVDGLIFLLQPLRILGFDHQRFARRLGLSLQQVDRMRERMQAARQKHSGSWADAAAELVHAIESQETSAGISVGIAR